jgi:site-specific recombinase XerD
MTQKFILQKQKGKEQALIVWQLFHKRKLFNYGTGIFILPQDWNSEDERIRKSYKGIFVDLNGQLNKYRDAFDSVVAKFGGLKAKLKNISAEQFKEAIDKELIAVGLRTPTKKQKDENEKTFIGYFEDFLRKDNKGKSKTLSTLTQYKATISILKEFNPHARLADINKDYFNKLKEYLYAKDYELNSVVNMVGRIKAVLNDLVKEGKITDLSYKNFEISKVETTQIALTFEEIEMIRKVKLEDETLNRVRDLFVFQCCTGIRFSDLQILKAEHFTKIGGDDYIVFNNVKTSKIIQVPLFPIAYQIAKKYDFTFKSLTLSLSNQIIRLQEIAKLAGLTEEKETISYPQGKKKTDFVPQYELIGTHTARRSFITYAHSEGMDIVEISHITGQTLPTVMRYIKPSLEKKKNSMSKLTQMSKMAD